MPLSMCRWLVSADDVLQRHGTPSQTGPASTPEAIWDQQSSGGSLREVSMNWGRCHIERRLFSETWTAQKVPRPMPTYPKANDAAATILRLRRLRILGVTDWSDIGSISTRSKGAGCAEGTSGSSALNQVTTVCGSGFRDSSRVRRSSVVRGHEKVRGYGHEKSALMATRSPRFWPREVRTPR